MRFENWAKKMKVELESIGLAYIGIVSRNGTPAD
jgi:hypothetical protein